MERDMGAVEITLISFIAVMAGIAGSCILRFLLRKSGRTGAESAARSLSASQRG